MNKGNLSWQNIRKRVDPRGELYMYEEIGMKNVK